MQRSKIVLPIHFVWATKRRYEWITSDWEPRVYACISSQAQNMGAEVLAIGGMPDHVHLAVMFGATHSPAQFMKQIKGATSRLIHEIIDEECPFYWQESYGVFAFEPRSSRKVIDYIENQKQHHAESKLWLTLEETTIEV